MTTQTITTLVVVAAAFALIGYDIWAFSRQDAGTISEVLMAAALHRPIISFAFGGLMGHLFWQFNPGRYPWAEWFLAHPIVSLVAGLVVGHLVAYQTPP